jgi:hypothetical protein
MKWAAKCIVSYLLVAGTFCACNQQPKSISVSENLLNSTGPYEDIYLPLLTKASDGDSVALVDSLKINGIEDASGYEHGFVVVQLMKSIGDVRFSKGLAKLNDSELRNISSYLEVGLDNDKENTALYKKRFPLSKKILVYVRVD